MMPLQPHWLLLRSVILMILLSSSKGFIFKSVNNRPRIGQLSNVERGGSYYRRRGKLFTVDSDASTADEVNNVAVSATLTVLLTPNVTQKSFRFKLAKQKPKLDPLRRTGRRRQRLMSGISSILRRLKLSPRPPTYSSPLLEEETLKFAYDCNILELGVGQQTGSQEASLSNATGILLIHPIGVGIGKWFYQRLLGALYSSSTSNAEDQFVVVVPDLLGSASACNAVRIQDDNVEQVQSFPLFNISDWTDQLVDLMTQLEDVFPDIKTWAVVANGGCSPIALQLAARSVQGTAPANVSHVVLSSVPSLPFFVKDSSTRNHIKVQESYKTLCGIPGRLFWWYACRNKGAFIQKFSEKNLVADPINLGGSWRSNCYTTAVSFGGKSRYSTFSFLAGTLQDGCMDSLNALKGTNKQIDVIKGADNRKSRARSWFWQRNIKRKKQREESKNPEEPRETFRDFIEKNGNGGREIVVGGRISLAHEDAQGYASAILSFLSDSQKLREK